MANDPRRQRLGPLAILPRAQAELRSAPRTFGILSDVLKLLDVGETNTAYSVLHSLLIDPTPEDADAELVEPLLATRLRDALHHCSLDEDTLIDDVKRTVRRLDTALSNSFDGDNPPTAEQIVNFVKGQGLTGLVVEALTRKWANVDPIYAFIDAVRTMFKDNCSIRSQNAAHEALDDLDDNGHDGWSSMSEASAMQLLYTIRGRLRKDKTLDAQWTEQKINDLFARKPHGTRDLETTEAVLESARAFVAQNGEGKSVPVAELLSAVLAYESAVGLTPSLPVPPRPGDPVFQGVESGWWWYAGADAARTPIGPFYTEGMARTALDAHACLLTCPRPAAGQVWATREKTGNLPGFGVALYRVAAVEEVAYHVWRVWVPRMAKGPDRQYIRPFIELQIDQQDHTGSYLVTIDTDKVRSSDPSAEEVQLWAPLSGKYTLMSGPGAPWAFEFDRATLPRPMDIIIRPGT